MKTKFSIPDLKTLASGMQSPKGDAAQEMAASLGKRSGLNIRLQEIGKYFSSSIFEKAIQTLDKSALIIISISWLVAFLAMGMAFLGAREAAALRVKVETAKALEPAVPKISRTLLNKDQYLPLLERLKKQFPGISFDITPKPSLRIYTNKSEEFMNWINAVSYTDSMVSAVRWSLASMCVGTECPGEFVMSAELVAEMITITSPEVKM